MFTKTKKLLSLLILAALVVSIIPVQSALAADPQLATGRVLTKLQTGDSSDWIEIATYDKYSLIIRKDTVGKTYFGSSPNYRVSNVKTAVDDWFNGRSNKNVTAQTLRRDARLLSFTYSTDAATFNKEGGLASINLTHLSKPLGTQVKDGNGVAFLLNFTEAALFCSTQYATGPLSGYEKSSAGAIKNYLSLNAPGGAQPENHFWLRTPGNLGTLACTVGLGGMSTMGERKGAVNQYDITSNIIKIRPALWVVSSIFDDTSKVIYNANNGTNQVVTVDVAKNTSYTVKKQDFINNGYEISGYNTSADGTGTPYSIGDAFTVTGDITLYTQWKAIAGPTFNISYNANGGTGPTEVFAVPAGSDVTVTDRNYRNPGYIFTGYNTSSDGTGTAYAIGDTFKANSDTTLYAQWQRIVGQPATVTYNPNYAEGGEPIVVDVTVGDDYVVEDKGFIRPHYILSGYTTNANGTGISYKIGDIFDITGNVILYAKWTRSEATTEPRATVSKLLKVPRGTALPTAEYKFTVRQVSEDGKVPSVLMPIITVDPIGFFSGKPSSEFASITSSGDYDLYYVESNELFGNVVWPHGGIYDYEISENENTATVGDREHYTYSKAVYDVKVYVSNTDADNDGRLDILQIICVKVKDDDGIAIQYDIQAKVNPTPGNSKMIFTNEYWKDNGGTTPENPEDWTLSVSKTVTGTLSDLTLYFTFELAVKAPGQSATPPVYKAYVVEADPANPGKYKVVTSLANYAGTIGSDGSISFTSGLNNKVQFNLKNGQNLVFINLPAGTVYAVKEFAVENYTPSVSVSYFYNHTEKTGTSNTTLSLPEDLDKDSDGKLEGLGSDVLYVGDEVASYVDFTNTRDELIPTGLNVNALPFSILLALALISLITFVAIKTKKRQGSNV